MRAVNHLSDASRAAIGTFCLAARSRSDCEAMILWRAVAGFFLALVIAGGARRARSLSPGGTAAAVLLGTITVAAGWRWGIILIAFFVSSSLLSRLGAVAKARRTDAITEKGGERDAVQVLANGGAFAAAALLATILADDRWTAIALGAIAASSSDTWATEIGTLLGGRPRSILTWRALPAGISGGVTVVGFMAAALGGAFIAFFVPAFGWSTSLAVATAAGGFIGSTADSLLGATVQGRRWCDRCAATTERRIHPCGTETTPRGGFAWIDNDVVNLLSSVVGGLAALVLA